MKTKHKPLSLVQIKKFQNIVLNYYNESSRHHLPWRRQRSPYRIVVSEIMLQQTQVDRVIPFFKKWIKKFPSWRALAQSERIEVLKHWKGLGYNSRAIRLHELAKIVVHTFHGKLPQDEISLRKLPGIGPYTASAVSAFAWNKKVMMIETNIRRVYLYHFFSKESDVSDRDIYNKLQETFPDEHVASSCMWYWALMDYGSYLGKTIVNPNRKSKHYSLQKPFKNSQRFVRGRILEQLLSSDFVDISMFQKTLSVKSEVIQLAFQSLERENIIKKEKNLWVLVK